MKKKIIIPLLLTCMSMLTFTGCGGEKAENLTEETVTEEVSEEIVMQEVEVSEDSYFTLSANGGTMLFDAEEDFESTLHTYFVEGGYSLEDAMKSETENALISVEKDGAQFAGWSVYVGDSAQFLDTQAEKDGAECFMLGVGTYLLLENCESYRTYISTEELCELICNGKYYYAVANWQ